MRGYVAEKLGALFTVRFLTPLVVHGGMCVLSAQVEQGPEEQPEENQDPDDEDEPDQAGDGSHIASIPFLIGRQRDPVAVPWGKA